MGKWRNVCFLKSCKAMRSRKLELVHTDFWASPIQSIVGSHYYLRFIDDYHKKVQFYILKFKFDLLDVFKKWKAQVKIQTDPKLKYLTSNNDREDIDGRFKQYCIAHCIRMEKTILRIPQKNSVFDHIRTINEHAKSMGLYARLPHTFQLDIVSITVYLIKNGPLVPFDYNLVEEVWSGKDV